MTLTNLLLIGALIYGTFLILGLLFEKEMTWGKKMERLNDFLGGKMEPIDNHPNSYRIRFIYEGQKFEFEGIEDPGFKVASYKGFLKTKSQGQLILGFVERERTTVYSEVGTSSDIINPNAKADIVVPNALREFKIYASNAKQANDLFSDKDIVSVFTAFKNLDPRGHPVMSLDIKEGMVVLHFHPSGLLKPSLAELLSHVKLMQKYLDKVLLVVRTLDHLDQMDKSR